MKTEIKPVPDRFCITLPNSSASCVNAICVNQKSKFKIQKCEPKEKNFQPSKSSIRLNPTKSDQFLLLLPIPRMREKPLKFHFISVSITFLWRA
jgi:hypothetical protein